MLSVHRSAPSSEPMTPDTPLSFAYFLSFEIHLFISLSAVSQQILTIQTAIRRSATEVELIGRTLKLDPSIGIFITMNPGYIGRSNLPDNLKQLFRSVAMTTPDSELIAQVPQPVGSDTSLSADLRMRRMAGGSVIKGGCRV